MATTKRTTQEPIRVRSLDATETAPTSTHTLVGITVAVHLLEDGRECNDGRYCGHCKPRPSGIGNVRPGSALIVPPPPDYSTPKAVSARCREAGSGGLEGFATAASDTSFRKAYREFRQVVMPCACRVEDTHNPKVRAVWMVSAQIRRSGQWVTVLEPGAYAGQADGRWELVPIEPPAVVEAKPRKRTRRMAEVA